MQRTAKDLLDALRAAVHEAVAAADADGQAAAPTAAPTDERTILTRHPADDRWIVFFVGGDADAAARIMGSRPVIETGFPRSMQATQVLAALRCLNPGMRIEAA